MDAALLVLQAMTSAATVAMFLVFWGQLHAMRSALDASRVASANQNLVTLISALQVPDLVEDRFTLIQLAKSDRPPGDWTEEEEASAERVCNSFDIAAILIEHGVVPDEPVLLHWGDSIVKCHAAAAPLIADFRQTRGPDYWRSFERLAERARTERAAALT